MQFGKTIGTACSSFAITNIDDIFVLVTFMAEASTSKVITPLKITIGQYVGFTIIIIISMIGFGVSLVLPSEPIGFLGFMPILLGVWSMLDLFIIGPDDDEAEDAATRMAAMRSIFKVALVTLMNGGDNIGTYIPLFSQTKGVEIVVYVVVYYILVGVWCLAAFLIMRQRHVLHLGKKYASYIVPFLYVGLGIFILVKSDCFPWSIEHIDESRGGHLGRTIMAVITTGLLLICIGLMIWFKWKKRSVQAISDATASETPNDDAAPSDVAPEASSPSSPSRQGQRDYEVGKEATELVEQRRIASTPEK